MKKGFTLIELLAVIVILAIIAVIAVPIVIDIIEDTKINSVKTSASMYLKSAELYISNAELNKVKINPGTYSITKDGNICIGSIEENKCNGEEIKIDVKGRKPSSGQIIIGDNTKIRIADALVDGYACSSKKNDFICLKDTKEKVSSENGWLTIEIEKDTALSNYRVYGNTIQNEEIVDIDLPEAYQLVEYIESTGAQYLVIDYIASGITSVKGKYQITDTSKATFLFGSRTSGGTSFYGLNWGGGVPYKYYNSYLNGKLTNVEIDDQIHTFYKDKGKLYIDSTEISSIDQLNFTTPSNMNVFGCASGDQLGYLSPYAKIFELKFYDNDILMVDLIPCYRKSDGLIGMYDVVNSKFYTNQGTGEFLKGNDLAATQTTSLGDWDSLKNKYKMQIKTTGKNLFDINKIKKTSYLANNNGILTISRYGSTTKETLKDLCPDIKVGDTITFKMKTTGHNLIYLGKWGSNWIIGKKYTITQAMLDSTVTFYTNVNNKTEEAFASNIQFEKGEKATEYEPYISSKKYDIYIDEPLRCIEEVCDYIDFLDGQVVRKVGIESDGTLKLLDRDIVEKVDLPNIELKKGTNNIYIDSNILPTKLDVEYYK